MSILSIDQGTTSSRAILFSEEGEILETRQKELTLVYPQKGWVEQDPEHIWQDTLWACEEILDHHKDVHALGITNQRETTLVWNKVTGQTLYNAIVWQDRRTAELCESLKENEAMVQRKTGLMLDPYFSATKIAWILDHVEGARALADKGALAFGTVDCFLIWRLTQGKQHLTDITNASRTMLYNVVEQKWDEELCTLFHIPMSMLPDVKENVDEYGQATALSQPLPICGVAGDQQAALIGQACFETGMVKSTYGTGCFALMNIGTHFKVSKNRLLTTVAYKINGQINYALEGSIFVAGAAIQWLRDNLEFFEEAKDSEALARSVEDSNGVTFVPAFTGLGAPYWNPNARAAILGLTRESNKAHITRAALEAQAFQTYDLMGAMEKDSGGESQIIRVDGGLVHNQFVCQFLADILEVQIDVPVITETTALGAAYLAGIGAGFYKGLEDISKRWHLERSFSPAMDLGTRQEALKRWEESVRLINQSPSFLTNYV